MNKIQKLEMWCQDMDAQLWEANKKGIYLIPINNPNDHFKINKP